MQKEINGYLAITLVIQILEKFKVQSTLPVDFFVLFQALLFFENPTHLPR